MSFPPTSSSLPPTAFQPEPLLAVACPACFGAIAVGSELLGQSADCPLCGRGFRVPVAAVADAPGPQAAASPEPVAPAPRREDSRRRRRESIAERSAPAPLAAALQDTLAEPPPSAAPDPELQFREPVQTVVSGDQVITLRRLTPEEKAARRARRNLVMMLAGVSILMAIVLLLGTKRPRRRS